MKAYKKAEMIAKNLPTGSYAAGCPANVTYSDLRGCIIDFGKSHQSYCKSCERAQ